MLKITKVYLFIKLMNLKDSKGQRSWEALEKRKEKGQKDGILL